MQQVDRQNNFREVFRVLWITLGLNLIATVAKLGVGYWTNSLSLIADGFDSAFDAASNIIGLVGIQLASRPADEDHPYGHRKAETMTAMIISSLLFLTTWELIKSAVERLRNPTLIQAEVNIWSFGALLVSILVHALVVWYELRAGRRLHSDVLVADALHTRADIFVSLSVMGGLIAVRLGFPLADPILALIVAVLIAKIGVDIIRESSAVLMDRVMVPYDQVERIALAVPGVFSCHQVRSRGYDDAIYVDLRIRVDPAMSTEQAHTIAHQVESQLRAQHPHIQDVTIHVEPVGTLNGKPKWEHIAVQLRRLADGLGLGVHNVWAYEVEGQIYAEVHLETDTTHTLREAHAQASHLEERARAEIVSLVDLVTHIEPRGQLMQSSASTLDKDAVLATVNTVVQNTLGVEHCHQIQTHPTSAMGWTVTMHCSLPEQTPITEAHRISTQLEDRLQREILQLERVVIHTEPFEATS